jgi:hypothetical protein
VLGLRIQPLLEPADLAGVPTSSSYTCRGYYTGNFESCYALGPEPGIWYVRVHAYTTFKNVTLVSVHGAIRDDYPHPTFFGGAAGSETRRIEFVPEGVKKAVFWIKGPSNSGGSGNANVYVKFGNAPTTTSFDCAATLGGNLDVCTINDPPSGNWHVLIHGASSFSNIRFRFMYER